MPPKKGKGGGKGSGKKGGGGGKGKPKGGSKNSTGGSGNGQGQSGGTTPPSTNFVPVPVPVPVFPGAAPGVQAIQAVQAIQPIQTPQSQVPIEADSEEQELVEGEDYFFEDTLREVLRDAMDPASVEVVTYPRMGAPEFVNTCDAHLTNLYGDLALGLTNQIEDYEHRCNYAKLEHDMWKSERYRLMNEKAALEKQADHERQAALNTRRQNRNNLHILGGRRNRKSDGMRDFLAARDSGGLLDIDFRGLDSDDGNSANGQSRCRRCTNWLAQAVDWAFPLGRDVKVISSHFGFAAGSFFDFHRSLLQLSVVVLFCHFYLLIQQFIEHWPTLTDYPVSNPNPPRLPAQFMIGGFHDGNVREHWTTGFSNQIDNLSQPLPGASDMNETYFNWLFTACPVVRHMRDCRVASVFAGRIDLENLDPSRAGGNYSYRYTNNITRTYEYSPYNLFRNNFQQVPGVKDEDYVIVSSFGAIQNPSSSSAFTTWTSTCNITDSSRPDVGYPGYCSDSRWYWTGPFVLDSDTQNNHQQFYDDTPKWTLAFGSSIEVYTGSDCPVAQKEDILQIAAGTNRNTVPLSGRNQWLALRYQVASVGSVLVILFFVLRSWYKAELVYRIEFSANEISSVRWSAWVLAAWDFRYEDPDDQELWKESLANELRAEMEEEINEEREDKRNRFKAWFLSFKRILGIFVNLIMLAIAWTSIVAAYIFQDRITTELSNPGVLSSVGRQLGLLAPNLTIAVVGLLLPSATKFITRFEERTRDSSARWNLYRLFFAKIFNALLYFFLVGELVYSEPLVYERFLSQRDCHVDTGYTCAEDQAGVRLLGLLVSECFFSLFLKPVLRLFRSALIFAIVSTFCRRSQPPPPLPPPAGSPDDDDDDEERSAAGDSEKGHHADPEFGNRAFFKWPEFEIADSAVDTVYVQFLMWLTVRYIPTAAISVPVILFFHFKWLKITLKYLASRPFITETSALRVNLQRVLLIICVAFALVVIISQFFRTPFEARCGPFDSHQAPARMTLSLLPTEAFDSIKDTLEWLSQSWLLVLVIAFICILQNLLQLSVLRNANDSVLETMHYSGEEQESYLRLRRYRLNEKIELYRKRISWLGEVDKTSKGK